MNQQLAKRKKQAGATLVEIIMWLAIAGMVIGGALSLGGIATSSTNTNDLIRDLTAIKTATKGLYYGQGGYGTAVVNDSLVTAKRVPDSWTVNTATTPDTITHQLNGTVTVTGATTTFTVAVTNLPQDVCASLMTTGGSGWVSVKANASPARTPPVAPATAAADCGASSANTLTFTAQ
jgi:type II secretory pathway pseudopilin PulG